MLNIQKSELKKLKLTKEDEKCKETLATAVARGRKIAQRT